MSRLWHLVALLATRQHGIVHRDQLLHLGLSRRAIERRLEAGLLRPLYRGVYAVGHEALTPRSRWMAATLRVGEDAWLSSFAAAALGQMRTPPSGWIDVSCPRRVRAEVGIRVHRRHLPDDEVMVLDGIPATGPARTMFDLAAVLTTDALFSLINQAEVAQVADHLSLPELLDRYPRYPGSKRLREVLAVVPDGGIRTRSTLEDSFLLYLHRHEIPIDGVNLTVHLPGESFERDFVWPRARLNIELDGGRFHLGPIARARDARRDQMMGEAGWSVVRVSDEDFDRDDGEIAAGLRPVLSAAGYPIASKLSVGTPA